MGVDDSARYCEASDPPFTSIRLDFERAGFLAARFRVSRNLFDLRFREAVGHSPLDEILHVRLGGDRYFSGSTEDGDGTFYKWGAVGAGFNGGAFAAYAGDGMGGGEYRTDGTATPGHWYRFVVASETAGNGASEVSVYDMGTAHPALATPTPVSGAVAAFSALPFRRSSKPLGGVSCVAVQARGVKAANPLDPAFYRLLVDNIAIEFNPSATVFVVR